MIETVTLMGRAARLWYRRGQHIGYNAFKNNHRLPSHV